MKRTLSLVLALVMVLGMIPVYAQAATPQEEAGKLLEQLGVLKGDQNGNLMLDKTLLRRDAVVMLARLLGEEEVAEKYPTAPTWKDVTIKYYIPFLGWAQAEGYYKGYNDAKFGFTDDITVQDYALVLLRALGYTDVEWKDAYTKAKDLGLLEGITLEATAKLLRGNMSVMTVTALNTKVKDTEKTLAETLGIEMPAEFAVTAKATGAKKITVTFNKAVDKTKAVITVNKGSIAVNTESIVFADDAKSAVITTVTNLTKGDYTVKVTGLTEEPLTATFTAEDVKVSKIELLLDKAPMKGNVGTEDGKKALVNYRVLNQYGEAMTGQTINWTASTGQPLTQTNDGKLELVNQTYFTPNQVVYLTGVHVTSGTVFNGQVTVVLPSNVDTVEFKGVYDKTDGKILTTLPAGFDDGRYELLFVAKDQYGNTTTAETNDVVFTSNNPLVVAPSQTIASRTVSGTAYQAVALTRGQFTNNGGTAVIQGISIYTGKTTTYTLDVPAVPMVKNFAMSAPATVVAEGEEVAIPFTAVDQFGNQITKYSTLKAAVDSGLLTFNYASTNGAKLEFVKNTDGTAKLVYTAPTNVASETVDYPIYIYATVLNGTGSQVSFNIKDTAVATVIVGLTDVKTTVVKDATTTIAAKNIKFQDQYGRTDTWNNYSGSRTIVATSTDTNVATVSGNEDDGFVITGVAKGTTTIKFVIKDGANEVPNSAYVANIVVVNPSEVVTYEIADLPLLQQGTTTTLKITGKLENGTPVVVNPSVVKQVVVADTSVATASGITIGAIAKSDTTLDDAKTSVVVTIEGATGPVIITKELTVSYKPPKAVKIEVDPEITVANFNDDTLLKEFTVYDQYGNEITANKGIIVKTNEVKEGNTTVQWTVTLVTPNGLTATTIAHLDQSK